MEDWFIPRKLLRKLVIGLFVVALVWGVVSGDMANTGKLIIDGTKPLAERIEKRLLRVFERALDVQDVSQRVLRSLMGIPNIDLQNLDDKYIIVSEDLTPSTTAGISQEHILGILTEKGGKTSHTAILARTLNIPALVGVKKITDNIKTNDLIALNAQKGEAVVNPDSETLNSFENLISSYADEIKELEKFKTLPGLSADGRQIKIHAELYFKRCERSAAQSIYRRRPV